MNDEQASPPASLPQTLAKDSNNSVKQPPGSYTIDVLAMAGFVASLIVPVSPPAFVLAWVIGSRPFSPISWVWFALISSSVALGLSVYARRNRHLAAR